MNNGSLIEGVNPTLTMFDQGRGNFIIDAIIRDEVPQCVLIV